MRRIAFILPASAGLGLALFLLTVPALASDIPNERATLKGLKAVNLTVERIDPEAEKDGLTKSQLQTDVESRLRQAGISVDHLSDEYLYVDVNTLKGERGVYSYSVHVEFHQSVMLVRDPKIIYYGAATWSVGRMGTVGSGHLREVREDVAALVDQFINAYLEQNPRQ